MMDAPVLSALMRELDFRVFSFGREAVRGGRVGVGVGQ